MLFLEDLYATKRPTLEERRAQLAAKQPRPIRRQIARSETQNATSTSTPATAQNDRYQPSKRTSLFSRRKSLAPTPTPTPTQDAAPSDVIYRTQTAPAIRRQTTTEMAGADDNLKSKFLSSWHPGKRAGSRKSVPPSKTSPTTKYRPSNSVQIRDVHKRAMSVGGSDAPTHISRPFGFQHLAKIERSPKPNAEIGGITQSSTVAFTPIQVQNGQPRRPQGRPPPLRPKRPDENQVPSELLSPRYGMPALRQIRSAEPIATPMTSPRANISLEFSPQHSNTASPPPRGSSKLAPVVFDDRYLPDRQSYASHTTPHLPNNLERFMPYHEKNHPSSTRLEQLDIELSERMPLPSPLLSAPLEQVLEEPEGTTTPRPLRDSTRYSSLRQAKSSSSLPRVPSHFEDLEPFLPRISLLPSIMLPRPISGGSDTMGDLSLRAFTIDDAITKAQQVSEVVDAFDFTSSWDDDIVFCYTYGAEAHSDFDWYNTSKYIEVEEDVLEASIIIQEPNIQRGRRHEFSSSWASTSGSESGIPIKLSGFEANIVPKRESVPELEEHVLSHSGSSNSLIIGTPQDHFGFTGPEPDVVPAAVSQRKSGDSLDLISPQLPPLGLKHNLDSDQLFDDLMAGFNIKQQHSATLPTLEPKTYSGPSQRKKSTHERAPKPSAPTSALNRISSASLDKELPPLPLNFRNRTPSCDSNMQTMEVCLDTNARPRNSFDGFGKAATEPIRQAQFARMSPMPAYNHMFSGGATCFRNQHGPNAIINTRSINPYTISRAESVDTVVTAVTAHSSPPRSPGHAALRPVSKFSTRSSRSSSDGSFRSKNPVLSFTASGTLQAAKRALRGPANHKKAASADGLPLRQSVTSVTSPRYSAPTYSLFPAPLPPPTNIPSLPATRMRRLTAL